MHSSILLFEVWSDTNSWDANIWVRWLNCCPWKVITQRILWHLMFYLNLEMIQQLRSLWGDQPLDPQFLNSVFRHNWSFLFLDIVCLAKKFMISICYCFLFACFLLPSSHNIRVWLLIPSRLFSTFFFIVAQAKLKVLVSFPWSNSFRNLKLHLNLEMENVLAEAL